MRFVLRIVIGLLILAALGVAIVPLLVLLDLGGGGTGWGLCPDGIAGCRTSYFSGLEFVTLFLVVLFSILGVIRAAVVVLRWVEGRRFTEMNPLPGLDGDERGPLRELLARSRAWLAQSRL